MSSYKPLRRWVQWRLPWTCYLHCHRACKLNDLGLHREVWDTSSWCQQVFFPAGSHSLPLRAPCFPEQLLCDSNLLSMYILACFQMRAEEKGATVGRMFCMRSLSVLFCSSPFLAILICNRSLAAWNCVCILVSKPRDSWENNITFWLIRHLGHLGLQPCDSWHERSKLEENSWQWFDPAFVLVLLGSCICSILVVCLMCLPRTI